METKTNTLHVLYQLAKCLPENAMVLSFLPPDAEYRFVLDNKVKLLCGRREMDAVREKARKAYIDLVARIAATPCNGKTLRQSLQIENCGNPWWYHKISERDAEADDTFNMLLQIFTILHIAERERINDIAVYGSSVEIAGVLATRYRVNRRKIALTHGNSLIKGILSRLKYLSWVLYSQVALRKVSGLPEINPEVVLHGVWDSSLKIEGHGSKVRDGYFKLLPEHLRERGMRYAWFLWLDRYSKPAIRNRPLSRILAPAVDNPSFVFVQKFLKLRDIISVVFDFRPLFRYLRYSGSSKFKHLFKEEDCDYWPLFGRKMFYHFCDASIPQYFLMETAYRRAFSFYKPKLSLTFIELLLPARAFNQGSRLGSPQTIKCDMQHASYGREKTFILMDSDREFRGRPDGIAIPTPDYFFVMGELAKDILTECGFPSEKIFITGSARYDYLRTEDRKYSKNRDFSVVKILLVPTLNIGLDFEMVQAAFFAAQGLNIQLYLRSHPFASMEDVPLYRRYAKFIISSNKPLEQDLDSADLVLFTYSTVAEEAFLKGIPVIRWQCAGFNGSVFRDLKGIPVVYSVAELKEAFQSFLKNPLSLKPKRELYELVLRKCFFKEDGGASDRIAQKIQEILR